MTTYTVHNQAELDAAIRDHGDEACTIRVDSDPGVCLRITESGRLADLVVDSASVVSVGGSARVVSVGGSARVESVGDSASVEWVGGSARIEWVGGSARIEWVGGSARIEWVGDSARIEWVGDSARIGRVGGSARVVSVGDSASVEWVGDSARVGRAAGQACLALHDEARIDQAGKYVCVYLHSALATVNGGHVIDLTRLDLCDPQQWADYTGAEIDGGDVLLFKAVDDQYQAGHSYRLTTYAVGSTVAATDWRDDHECGGGLHASPTPAQARSYYAGATRMLVVAAPLASIRSIGDDKCKAPSLRVVCEVALDGSELAVSS